MAERRNFQPRAFFGKSRSPKSDYLVIVVPVDPEAGAAGLAGLPADGHMRQHLDLDGDLAGGWRDTLADPDGNPRGDVFPGAERGAAGGRIAPTAGVQGSGCRPLRRAAAPPRRRSD